jgi:hypothetical protein
MSHFFVCLVFTAIIASIVYHLPVLLSLVISVTITAGFFLGFWNTYGHTYKFLIDKSEDYIYAWKDNKKIYESDYPLSQIKNIKTTIHYKYGRLGWVLVSLIVVLKNNEEKVIDTSNLTDDIDVVGNKQAEAGKKIAEFLDVPFIGGEYHPPLI